jgi:hypothetical protein
MVGPGMGPGENANVPIVPLLKSNVISIHVCPHGAAASENFDLVSKGQINIEKSVQFWD